MDFDFTQEQVMLRDLTREFLTHESTPRAVRTLMEDERGYSDATWQQMAEMGLQGLAIDAGYGGQGLGMIELALVLDEMGRAAYPGRTSPPSVLAAAAHCRAGSDIRWRATCRTSRRGARRRRWRCIENALSWTPAWSAARRAAGHEFVLSGAKRFVPFAHVADLILVVARTSATADGTTVFAVPSDAPGLRRR